MTDQARTVLVALAAAAVLVAAAAVGAWAIRSPPGDDRLAQSSSRPSRPTVARGASGDAPAAATTAGPAIPTADPEPWREVVWSRVPGPFGELKPPHLRVDGLTTLGDALVAWGRAPTPGRNQFNDFGAVFVSMDGARWRTVVIDHGVGRQDTSEITGVAAGPRGLLAFGGVCCEAEARAVWHSDDAITWRRLELGGDLDPRATYFNAVSGTPTGWVAVGSAGMADQHAMIWTSTDGAVWTAVADEEAGLGPGTVADVAWGPAGLVAVGTIDDDAGTHDGAVWTSTDGVAWARVAADDPTLVDPEEVELFSITPFAGGLFATGNYGLHQDRVSCERLVGARASLDPPPPPEGPTALSCGWGREHVWVSADGDEWDRIDPLAANGAVPIEFRKVVAGGPGLVLYGEASGPASPDPALWTSVDGRAWARVEANRPLTSMGLGLAARGREVLLIAEHWDAAATRSELEVWVGSVR